MNTTPDLVNQPLDPYAFFPDAASRIRGLGGDGAAQDPAYVLHTPYVPAAEGKRHFTVRFDRLTATAGSLLLRVHMLPPEVGAHAKLMNSQRIPLEQLAGLGGEVTIGFDGYAGMRYALYGAVADNTDARADALQVLLDLGVDPDARNHAPTVSAATAAVGRRLSATPQILTLDRPTFAVPVSQYYTPAQMKEREARDIVAQFQWLALAEPDLWSRAIVLQIARRYGALSSGSRFIGIGGGMDVLPALFAAGGADVAVATDAGHDDAPPCDPGRFDAPGPRGAGGRPVTSVTLGPDFDIQSHGGPFDLLWSDGPLDLLPPEEDGFAFMMRMLAGVRAGGLAVHRLKLVDDAHGPMAGAYRARDLQRWALTLIAHGHEVAQLKLPLARTDRSGRPYPEHAGTPFVFIVRRSAG